MVDDWNAQLHTKDASADADARIFILGARAMQVGMHLRLHLLHLDSHLKVCEQMKSKRKS